MHSALRHGVFLIIILRLREDRPQVIQSYSSSIHRIRPTQPQCISSRVLPLRNLFISLLYLRSASNTAQPLRDHGILIETQLRELVLRDPRVEVHVYGAVTLFEDRFAVCSFERAFEYAECAVGLFFVAFECFGVGGGVVVAVPKLLAHGGSYFYRCVVDGEW